VRLLVNLGKFYNFEGLALKKYSFVTVAFIAFSAGSKETQP
jgi:hypothetical protein